jgi:hypothetical protein
MCVSRRHQWTPHAARVLDTGVAVTLVVGALAAVAAIGTLATIFCLVHFEMFVFLISLAII